MSGAIPNLSTTPDLVPLPALEVPIPMPGSIKSVNSTESNVPIFIQLWLGHSQVSE